MPLITLTTDFGSSDSYVAQMKGVILAVNPNARIVDVTHSIPPQDVARAAVVIESFIPAFPAGTLHVAVIDPGVGSSRRLLAAEAAGQRFLAPDNGVLAPVFNRWPPSQIRELQNDRFWRNPISSTFHGRDILAPVAAHWSLDVDPTEFGPTIELDSLVPLHVPLPHRVGSALVGRVEYADSFGNLITNIAASDLGDGPVEISIAGRIIGRVWHCYSDQPVGAWLALIGSSGRLEIAVNGGSAARMLNVMPGAEVRVEPGERGT
jgi:hypothetical protein